MLPYEIWLVLCREITHRYRQPTWLVMGIAQPCLYMIFFGPLVEKYAAYTPGFPPGGTWLMFAPALMVQMVIIGSSFVGVSLLAEYRSGVFERFSVSPMKLTALLTGKVLAVVVSVLVQGGIIALLCVVVFGARPPVGGVALCLLIVAVLSAAIASASYGLALRLRSEEKMPAVLNTLLMPLFLLSGTLLPITTELAPDWLWKLSRLNPVAYVMDADRASFRGDFSAHSLLPGTVALTLMTSLSFWWAARTFARHNAGIG
ncbi:ABC transporter permease [Streptomyces sp. NPDC006654]|uniref:ABC transporter permease n=1 Tax=Streptomyces sp. NPDC006654 TaxID=3156897 RepID=UPI0033F8EB07